MYLNLRILYCSGWHVVQQIQSPLVTLALHMSISLSPSYITSDQLPAHVPGRAMGEVQGACTLVPHVGTLMEFQAPGFSLAQPWLLWSFWE